MNSLNLSKDDRVMSEELRMSAYYYGFEPTGVYEIDVILSAVATAGRAFHYTENWQEDCAQPRPFKGKTPEEWIQNAANEAAAFWNRRHDETPSEFERLCGCSN